MRITFVGSGGVAVTKQRCCACFLIDEDILIDCGSGAVKNLRKMGVNLSNIKKVLISHYHADHISDLVPLLWALELEGYREPIEIMGYGRIEKVVKGMLKTMKTPESYTVFNLRFTSLRGGEEIGEIKCFLTKHKPKNLAYRIERNGKSVCYSGDTRFYKPLANFASNCNVLIHDTTFLDEQKELASLTNHSTASQAGKIARMANVDILVLTHFFPNNVENEEEYVKQASKEFKGKIILARDLQTIEI